MICRYKVFYLFLLTVPFFNILVLNFGHALVQSYILFFFSTTFLLFRQKLMRTGWISSALLVFGMIVCLSLSQIHSLFNLDRSNIDAILFFGLFVPVLVFYILFYDQRVFAEKYWDKLLRFYILVFSSSILIDYVILHSALDVSLQPMYRQEALSYLSRPFGITGQPSVNSVLLVTFYALLLSQRGFNESIYIFSLMVIAVLLQGSGSGFIALAVLLTVMFIKVSWPIRIFCPIGLVILYLFTQQLEFFNKISIGYLSEVSGIFISQIDEWIISVKEANIDFTASVLFGGVPSGIDFGPLYFISNVGVIYLIFFLITIGLAALKAKERYEKTAFLILLLGNLHYPVMFYTIMAFFLPILLQRNIFTVKCNPKNLVSETP